ncbi:Dehydrogenase/reductase SDR family member on chromosome X [Microtus ochrogaster]|uniref:Dehydrogenase/reductase SDR family member on chromosome X n=1 Tax=Microtus ochrogaster TaxID=79684 RepID=A0A8J6KSS2_MICOH|nr:Dehydrogenase/reductase SDR family member on chromosome X [Microtus ochrogaster]
MLTLRALRATVLVYAPDRVAIVTGGTDGIGLATARRLGWLGMRVVIAGNNAAKANDVVSRIREETKNEKVHFLFCDLASLRSVRKFARDFLSRGFPLHVLVNNAGVMMVADVGRRVRGPGWSPWHRPRTTVVTVASATHYVGELDPADPQDRKSPYSAHAAYARSKLALVLFSQRLQRLLAARGDPVTANLVDPGVVDTALFRHVWWGTRAVQRALGWLLFKTPDEGAWTSVYAAAAPELEGVGGRYLYNEAETQPLGLARDVELQAQLWAESCRLAGIPDGMGFGVE